jgi:hypothetical protein
MSFTCDDSFYCWLKPISFAPSSGENKLQFRKPNLIQKFDGPPKQRSDVIEYKTCKKRFDISEEPEVEYCQVRTVW